MDAVEEQFKLRTKPAGNHEVRVFADNHTCLSEIYGCFDAFADRELVVCDDERLTYGECARRAAKLADALRLDHQIEPGSRVGLALPNSPDWLIAFVAITSLGATPALVNARAGDEEFNHCLTSTGCAFCLHDRGSSWAAPIPAMDRAGMLSTLQTRPDRPLPATARAGTDEALLMFTSGTTGLPKAAVLSHESLMTALKTIQYSSALIAQQMAAAYGIEYETLIQMRPAPVNLLVFPLFHVSGCHAVFLSSLFQGGKIVLMTRWDPERALELIAEERVTAFPGVPTMHRDILRLENRAAYDLSSLTSLSVGGQATPPALLADLHEAFPSAVLGSGYGMTECNGTITLNVGQSFIDNPASVGRVVATFDVEIRDDDGSALPAGETGEICARGAALMSGYANVDAPAIDADGWFATGDVGYLDGDDFLYVIDRKTDMVISGGENIYCAEVERIIDRHPAVRESAAFALPDDRLGEKLVAAVVLQPGEATTADDLTAHCADHLARHKVPRQVFIQPEPLPRNPSGKIIKPTIRTRYADAAGRTSND